MDLLWRLNRQELIRRGGVTHPLLFNMPTTPQFWLEWGTVNQFDHLSIDRQISQLFNQPSPGVPPLDPIPLDSNLVTWSELHQAVHTAQTAFLGVEASDLTSLDLRQPARVRIWIELHAREHQAMALALARLTSQQKTG